jgi:hypothetical protein
MLNFVIGGVAIVWGQAACSAVIIYTEPIHPYKTHVSGIYNYGTPTHLRNVKDSSLHQDSNLDVFVARPPELYRIDLMSRSQSLRMRTQSQSEG